MRQHATNAPLTYQYLSCAALCPAILFLGPNYVEDVFFISYLHQICTVILISYLPLRFPWQTVLTPFLTPNINQPLLHRKHFFSLNLSLSSLSFSLSAFLCLPLHFPADTVLTPFFIAAQKMPSIHTPLSHLRSKTPSLLKSATLPSLIIRSQPAITLIIGIYRKAVNSRLQSHWRQTLAVRLKFIGVHSEVVWIRMNAKVHRAAHSPAECADAIHPLMAT